MELEPLHLFRIGAGIVKIRLPAEKESVAAPDKFLIGKPVIKSRLRQISEADLRIGQEPSKVNRYTHMVPLPPRRYHACSLFAAALTS